MPPCPICDYGVAAMVQRNDRVVEQCERVDDARRLCYRRPITRRRC